MKQEENIVEKADTVSEKQENPTEITDCNYTFDEAIAGSDAPQHIIDQLVLLNVRYYSTDQKIHKGQIVVNQKIANEVIEIFEFMF